MLYARYLSGDEDTLRELVEQYGASLVLFINRYVNNISVAEELMEDVFCDLVMKRYRFRGASSFKTYLFTIAKNKAADYIRKCSKYGFVPIEDVEAELRDLHSLEDMVITEERKREVWRAMNELNEDYRLVLFLLYFEELSYDDIGKVLKRTRGQIKNLAYRARQALKCALEKGGFVYEEL